MRIEFVCLIPPIAAGIVLFALIGPNGDQKKR
jgi:hypothetical protein